MLRALMRKTHKWIFIFVGIFMLMWIVTGVIMSLPVNRNWVELKTDGSAVKADYATVNLSPAQAIANLKLAKPTIGKITTVNFTRHQGKVMYVLKDSSGQNYLVDTLSGNQVEFSAAIAESVTRKIFSIKQPVLENTLISKFNNSYPWGDLPVYQLRFDDGSSNHYFVNPANSKVQKSSWLTRAVTVSTGLHEFMPVYELTKSYGLRWMAMVFVGLIATIGAVSGIYLTLPRRKRK